MQNPPFVGNRFTLYDNDSFVKMIQNVGFNLINHIEEVKNKTGEIVKRKYIIVEMQKNKVT